ncbi:MAG: hypothetical protein M3O84_03830, partial [Actinomycetota bacterium]|nr:hypothetical protein [Actinomycetota bacterium]
MAEQMILVCDECGRPATKSVTIRVDGRNLVKDLCDADVRALVRNARTPKRGRKPTSVLATPKASGARRGPGRPRGSRNKKSTARKSPAKKPAARKNPAKKPAARKSPAKK